MPKVKHQRITIDLTDAKIDFEGRWLRADLDKAYRLMLKNLGAYYTQQRAKAREAAAKEVASVEPSPAGGVNDENEGANDGRE